MIDPTVWVSASASTSWIQFYDMVAPWTLDNYMIPQYSIEMVHNKSDLIRMKPKISKSNGHGRTITLNGRGMRLR